MDTIVRPNGLYVDSWLEDFLRTTLQFATWHAAKPVVSAQVSLRRRGRKQVVCNITASCEDGIGVSAVGVAAQAFEAIQLAADRIEVALYGPSSGKLHREGQPRAAA